MSVLSVWRPDALVTPSDYKELLLVALQAFQRPSSSQLALVLSIDPDRHLLAVTRHPGEGELRLEAKVSVSAPSGVTFPAPPLPRDMSGLGWRLGPETRSAPWTLGPVVADEHGLELLAIMLTGTLTRYDCPLGFVDIHLES